MSNSQVNYIYNLLFKVQILQKSGEAFMCLFNDVMAFSDERFQSIAPWGKWGDGGNDGFIQDEGHYFQVYAPKPNTNWSPPEAFNKAKTDFHKLGKKWLDVKKYSFVLNDRFEGSPAPLNSALQEFKNETSLELCDCLCSRKLLTRFNKLPDDLKSLVVGGVPNIEDVTLNLHNNEIHTLLLYLSDKSHNSKISLLDINVPDFERKITLNNLNPYIAEELRTNIKKVSLIDEYLDSVRGGISQEISNYIHEIYEKSKLLFNGQNDEIDLQYAWIKDEIIPPEVRNNPAQRMALAGYRSVSSIVLAKYFESCDVYEHPDSFATA
ncbi:ABC-three component system protein [Acinetobacter sp. B51(2017)]|uniref:ABC-three component system protein n=1 Tax=Acinetobacter sp. B51(2017) TaxID=2060938 RepID=UPI000F078AEC|nr:ABC-three component system protein [Acinetobacter sp. B51(2017)]